MAIEQVSNLKIEVGHVLFIDIVGYSKLLINEQGEVLQKLNDVVRSTEQVRAADAAGKLIRLPSGDGMALVFRDSPEAPAHCALEISAALKAHPEVQVRMGIHSGPVNEIVDVNERANIAGGGINIAQRVMDCGDAGHILLSKRVADDLAQYRHWQPLLHDLGECEVKHGVRISVANLYTGELGNSAVPKKLQQESERQTPAAVPVHPPRRLGRQIALLGTIILLVSALAAAWALFSRRGEQKSRPPEETFATKTAAGLAEKRIAILPFKPLVPEHRDQVLEIGMADTLIAKLSNSREIIVTSLTSVRKYGGLDQDPIAAGRHLGVNAVLEGNVQRAGDQIRVTARLISVADGASLWASTFDEKFTDVFTVQNAISQKVADALAIRLSGDEKRRVDKRETESVEAYQLYLTGRYHQNKLTPPELTKSINFFQQAIAMDPAYALAYAALADAYRGLAPTGDMRPKDVLPQAKAAAMKAVELDESLAEAHAALAFVHAWFDWDWAGAEREAKRAIALNPNSGFSHSVYAVLLSDLGQHEGAVTEAVRGREIEPTSLIVNVIEGSILYHARRNEEAGARLRTTLELDASFWVAHLFLGKVFMQDKQYAEALAEFAKARDFSGGNSEAIAMTGYVNAISGETATAREVLNQMLALSAQRYIPPHNVAVLYLGLGERDECFAWLGKAYEDHDVRLSFLKVDPKWDSFRSDPRFADLLKRIGLQ